MSGATAGDPAKTVGEVQKRRYDTTYFEAYRNEPKREWMYKQERARIEKLKPSGRILDVGCGLGLFLSEFPPERWDRYGVDVSDLAIEAARSRGIKVNDFARAYDYPDGFFDVVVLRGSLQLLPDPCSVIQTCIRLLAPGGYLVLLATPNSNSPYYRRFKTLPTLTPHANFVVPSDLMMRDMLTNYGLEVVDVHFPYLDTPYARPLRDHLLYALSFVGLKRKFAFWHSVMEMYARKPA
jgi:SAM-dependent methyltransferase